MTASKITLFVLTYAGLSFVSGITWCPLAGSYTDPSLKPGYRGDKYFSCVSCPEGTYSAVGNVLECTRCPEGTTSFGRAARVVASCTSCERGQVEVNGTCEFCPLGTFVTRDLFGTGEYECQECSDLGDVKLVTTPNVGTTSSDDCGCPPGYKNRKTYSSLGCVPCGGGSFSDSIGGECTKCPPHYTTLKPNSTSSDQCICGPGTYYDASVGYCFKCGIGYYSEQNEATSCAECPPDRTTVEETSDDISDCVCRPGYFENQFTKECQQCPEACYTDTPDSPMCSRCPRGQTASEDRTHCMIVPM